MPRLVRVAAFCVVCAALVVGAGLFNLRASR